MAMVLVLVPTALAHNLSNAAPALDVRQQPARRGRHAWLAREGVAAVQRLGVRSRGVAHAALGVAMQLGAWLGPQPYLAVAQQCTEVWPEVAHLRGARLRPGAERMRQLVRILRELSHPEDRVLFLPEDPNVGAWIERPRPDLTSAIAFAYQYWDRYVDEDFRRLPAVPPMIIVLGPRRFAPMFARAFGHRRWGIPAIVRPNRERAAVARYVFHASQIIAFQEKTDRMDVYVRRDSP